MCDSTQGSLCPSPMKIHQSMWILWPFSKPWTKGHWHLDDLWPQVCWSHILWLYPRIIVSKSHENTSVWIQWPLSKTYTKGQWPLDDLWPQVCWGHICDHCVQVPWEYINVCGYNDQFCKIPHTTNYIQHTYYVQNGWSHSLFLNTFRRDNYLSL